MNMYKSLSTMTIASESRNNSMRQQMVLSLNVSLRKLTLYPNADAYTGRDLSMFATINK